MKKFASFIICTAVFMTCLTAYGQYATTVTGNIKNSKTKEALPAVSVVIKGTSEGAYTDENGNFKFSTSKKPPFTLVISSIGYTNKEVEYNASGQFMTELEPAFVLGQEIVVAASRLPERILESPVSIERINTTAIRNAPATNYYDMIANLKGVDVVTASLTFKSPTTRGFNGSGNPRFNQFVDGMDNQAPGLNFSVGSIIGLPELDVESMELLQGASSALYGSGGMNGTLLINSKSPFKYQGLSLQFKQGVMNINNPFGIKASPYYDGTIRFAKKISDKFAFKIGAQYLWARDWVAGDQSNYILNPGVGGKIDPTTNRLSDPNYNGVNVYGDETSLSMDYIADQALLQVPAAGLAAVNGIIATNPGITLAQLQGILAGNQQLAPLLPASPFIYGAHPSNNYFTGNVSRTGYLEQDILNPNTINLKLQGGMYYKFNPDLELSLVGYWGSGNSVYTGSDRYSLKNIRIGQYKLELKHTNWFIRAYTTQENSGESFNATITTRLFNEGWKASQQWYPEYLAAYATARSASGNSPFSHLQARAFADQGRPEAGTSTFNALFDKIRKTPISQGGGLFLDRSDLYVAEAQYNLTDALKIGKEDNRTEVLIGGSYKQYVLNSQGTLFADTTGTIKINETGAYMQLTQRFFNDVLKITANGRYDKQNNFEGRFTPRISAVISPTKNHNFRVSYQTAYRFPTTQNQWINLRVGAGTVLIGGLKQLRDYYNFDGNKVYTPASVQAFGGSVLAGQPNPGLLVEQQFNTYKPEIAKSFEVGYKGLINNSLLIDAYVYGARYENFLGRIAVLQSKIPGNPIGLLQENTRTAYSVAVNSSSIVKTRGWGASLEYRMGKNFYVSGNVFGDKITDAPDNFITYFSTPKVRFNLGFGNLGLGASKRLGFGVIYRWQDDIYYESDFIVGTVPSFGVLDAMVSYKLPKQKMLFKLGGTNITNKYYINGMGNPSIGALYYISIGYNVF